MSDTEALDIAQVVTQALIDDAAVSGICAGRVTASYPVAPDQGTVELPRVAILFRPGRRLYGSAVRSAVLEVHAVARSSGEAMGLYDACLKALHAQRHTVTGVTSSVVFRETAGVSTRWVEALRAHSAVGRFTAQSVQ